MSRRVLSKGGVDKRRRRPRDMSGSVRTAVHLSFSSLARASEDPAASTRQEPFRSRKAGDAEVGGHDRAGAHWARRVKRCAGPAWP